MALTTQAPVPGTEKVFEEKLPGTGGGVPSHGFRVCLLFLGPVWGAVPKPGSLRASAGSTPLS